MIDDNGKKLRNIQEQVQKNKDDIERLMGGIKISYWVAQTTDLSPLMVEANVGKYIIVGNNTLYTITHRSNEGLIAINLGTYPAKGEKGDTGATGAQGLQGIQGIQGIQGAQGARGFNGAGIVEEMNPTAEATEVLNKIKTVDHTIYSIPDTTYTAGTGIEIDSDNEITVDTDTIATVDYVDQSVTGLVAQSELQDVEDLLQAQIDDKQDTINDLSTIRSGAALGATALQSVPDTYSTTTQMNAAIAAYHDNTKQDVLNSSNKLPYSYISGTPTIPTKTSDLSNDSGFITNSALSGYATTSALNNGLAGKQNTLSTAQLNACNSGITTSKVSTYDGYASTIAGKSVVSGTNDGTNWTNITINGTTKAIPQGGGGGGGSLYLHKITISLDGQTQNAMNIFNVLGNEHTAEETDGTIYFNFISSSSTPFSDFYEILQKVNNLNILINEDWNGYNGSGHILISNLYSASYVGFSEAYEEFYGITGQIDLHTQGANFTDTVVQL